MSHALWPLWAAAVTMLLLALGGLLWPLLRESREAPVDPQQRLRELYRRKRHELDHETLEPAERQQALDDLQRALLQELDDASTPRPAPRDGPWQKRLPAAVLSLALPVAALALYLHTGDPRAAAQLAVASPAMHDGAGDQLESAIARLDERLRTDPGDIEGWLVLARSQETLERFDDAARSYRQALTAATQQQVPGEILARLQADLADALGSARQGDLGGPAQQAIDAALALAPRQPKALALAGTAALHRSDFDAARHHWQTLLGLLEPGSDMALRVQADLERLSTGTTAPATASIGARITLDPALAGRVPAQATVFVVVRPAGERMPAAVLRLPASQLPANVVLDDRQSMSPDRPLSRFGNVTLQARISLTGQAQRAPGDWESETVTARVGQQGLALRISAGPGDTVSRP